MGGAGTNTFDFTAADQVVRITGEIQAVGVDNPQDEGDNGGDNGGEPGEEVEQERHAAGDPPITGDVLARFSAHHPGTAVSVIQVEDEEIDEGDSVEVGGVHGDIEMGADGDYSYSVDLSDLAVEHMLVGDEERAAVENAVRCRDRAHAGSSMVGATAACQTAPARRRRRFWSS